MAVEYIYLQGKAKWFKSQTPNKFGDYSHDIYLTDESRTKLEELKKGKGNVEGIKNSLKQDEDGYYVSLRRPQSKTIRGKVVGFAPPEILDRNGLPLHDILVGNGSDITTKVEYYTYKKPFGEGRGSAIRWASTRVDNLVPFVTQRDFDADQTKAVSGLETVPHQAEF
jgi:hypothetical protein